MVQNLKINNMENRIKIGDVWYVREEQSYDWYVREEQPIEEIKMNVISFDGRVFETDLYCFEATRLYDDDDTPYKSCEIKVTDKRVKPWKDEYLDNPIWFIEVLENNPESMKQAYEIFDKQGIAEFRAFVRDLISVGWVKK
jgi:hypothetical protein